MSQKSILEQALLQVQNLEEAVKVNAKGILESTMKQELKDLLKESMEEEEEVATEEEDNSLEEQPTTDEEDTDDMSDDTDDTEDDTDVDGDDVDDTENDDTDLDNESSTDSDDFGDDEDSLDHEGMEDEPSMEDTDDEDVMDMTGASHDEVLKVFKAMKPEDGIVVKKDGNKIEFNDGESDYIIKLDDEGGIEGEMAENDNPYSKKPGKLKERGHSIAMDENGDPYKTKVKLNSKAEKGTSIAMDENGDPYSKKPGKLKERGHSLAMDETDETVYEIELDDKDGKEGDQTEAARTFGTGVRGPAQKHTYQTGRHEMNEEISKLRKQNSEYKKALVLFKEKLNEVAVFNANLAHMTRLFTEQTTTKKEKLNIIKRFDSISTINESKNLFTLIETELTDKKPISEAVVEKISMAPTSSSTNVLSESKAYENPQFKRMKDLMTKIK